MLNVNVPPDKHVKVLNNQGWIGLIDMMGSETTIVNAARVSFGKIKKEMDAKDIVLLEYLIENKHTSPLEHLALTFSVYCPLFVRGQWHRHRTWSYNEISRRYTDFDITFYNPQKLRQQAKENRQASVENPNFDDKELVKLIKEQNKKSLELYEHLIGKGVCREQARGVLSQNMMVTFWATVNLHNLLHFLEIRDHANAQYEIREYAIAIKKLVTPYIPNVAKYLKW